MASSTSARFF
ncbi:hypothetical protein ECFRIK1990_1517, partial [Escherichia coli FRIK1990]